MREHVAWMEEKRNKYRDIEGNAEKKTTRKNLAYVG
jgi:hypothetical protein